MKVGSVVFSTEQGLGILAKDFYDNGIITDVIVLAHGRRPDHPEWYPNSEFIRHLDDRYLIGLCKWVDVMFFFETPFNWNLISICKELGVKTVLMPMYECMPRELPAQPDLFINPSLLDQRYYPSGKFIPIPVNRPWKLREHALTFVHNAGHGGLKGRNGTQELINAIPLVKSPASFIIRCQDPNNIFSELQDDSRVKVVTGTIPSDQLYDEGDVFLFPEKFNGLSLPLQEAYASGMLVMAGDRFPINTWLPNEPLIDVDHYIKDCVSPRCNLYDSAEYDPQMIAATIDAWYGKDISEYSKMGQRWARANSWDVLKPVYLKTLEELL